MISLAGLNGQKKFKICLTAQDKEIVEVALALLVARLKIRESSALVGETEYVPARQVMELLRRIGK